MPVAGGFGADDAGNAHDRARRGAFFWSFSDRDARCGVLPGPGRHLALCRLVVVSAGDAGLVAGSHRFMRDDGVLDCHVYAARHDGDVQADGLSRTANGADKKIRFGEWEQHEMDDVALHVANDGLSPVHQKIPPPLKACVSFGLTHSHVLRASVQTKSVPRGAFPSQPRPYRKNSLPPAEGSGSESASTACTTKQSLRSDWCSNFPAAFSTALAPPPAGGQNKQGLFCLVLGTSGGGRRLTRVLAKCGGRRGNHSWQRGVSSRLTI